MNLRTSMKTASDFFNHTIINNNILRVLILYKFYIMFNPIFHSTGNEFNKIPI